MLYLPNKLYMFLDDYAKKSYPRGGVFRKDA